MFVRDKFLFHFMHILLVLFQTTVVDMGQLLEGINHPVIHDLFLLTSLERIVID